jgi:exopolyphosphatase/pppGpp-phosphohydrolase
MACFGDACDAKIVIAASVARDNERFKPLSRWFEQNYKTKPIVLKQRQEAMLAYSAAINTLDLSKKPIVVDIGGLSTELIWGLERAHWYGAPLGLLSFAAPASNPTPRWIYPIRSSVPA